MAASLPKTGTGRDGALFLFFFTPLQNGKLVLIYLSIYMLASVEEPKAGKPTHPFLKASPA